MKKVYVFITPKKNGEDEEYEVKILDYIGNKFKLGRILKYDSYQYNGLSFLVAEYSKGKVRVKFREGKEGLAIIAKYNKIRRFRLKI